MNTDKNKVTVQHAVSVQIGASLVQFSPEGMAYYGAEKVKKALAILEEKEVKTYTESDVELAFKYGTEWGADGCLEQELIDVGFQTFLEGKFRMTKEEIDSMNATLNAQKP